MDGVKHILSSAMEVVLEVHSWWSQVIDESSLFNKVILVINADIFDLLLWRSQVLHLLLFANISPLTTKLLGLISRINVIEDSKFGTWQEAEVTEFNISEICGNNELVVENHSANPLIVRPRTHSRNRADWSNVEESEYKSTSASAQWFIMRGNLFWSNSLKQEFHVTIVRVIEWIVLSVVWMLVTLVHVS